ncbi:hypothetical protein [Ekhidna sp.]|jgi:hypothetical protein|uniref:hypothetical protein n=1 Tax=Ekhidna sp. TaxID=2608089 RepID=UPI0032EE5822
MLAIKNYLFVVICVVLLTATSCGSDDSDTPESSATVTFDGKVYQKPTDNEIAYIEFSVDDETSFSIGGDVVNGLDTVNFTVRVPNLNVATYTRSSNGGDAAVSVTPSNESTFSTSIFGQDTDMTDYEIQIIEVTNKTVSGTFSATVQSFGDESIKEVSGEFVAIDFASFFGF